MTMIAMYAGGMILGLIMIFISLISTIIYCARKGTRAQNRARKRSLRFTWLATGAVWGMVVYAASQIVH